jgi:hypothetical protein
LAVLLGECVDAILSQNVSALEILIMDEVSVLWSTRSQCQQKRFAMLVDSRDDALAIKYARAAAAAIFGDSY